MINLEEYTLINCTPHPIDLMDEEGNILYTFSPSQIPARADQLTTEGKIVNILLGNKKREVQINETHFSELINLPPPKENTLYIVSILTALVAEKAGRHDVVICGSYVRDKLGNIIGTKDFSFLS